MEEGKQEGRKVFKTGSCYVAQAGLISHPLASAS
jgi:hypothetical protein